MGLRVLLVATHFPPSKGYGGVCESSWGLANGLVNAGNVVDVVTSDATLEGRIAPKDFRNLERPGLRIHPFRFSFSPKHGFSFKSPNLIRDLIRSCEIVHANGILTHPVHLAASISRSIGRPYVVSLRNGLDPWMFQLGRIRKFLAFHTYVKSDIEFSAAVHVTSELEALGATLTKVKARFSVVPNGFDPHTLPKVLRSQLANERWPSLVGREVLLFLSRLSPQKGLDMLLEHWDEIANANPNLVLVIAGPDYAGHTNLVRRWIAKAKNASRVMLVGPVSGELKWALYARAKVFVLPSYTENFGNVITEALAVGTPVVTTQATPWQVIQSNGFGAWVPADAGSIKGALMNLLKLPDGLLREMGAKGQRYIMESLSWKTTGEKMQRLYEAILQNDPLPFQTGTRN